MPSLRQTQGKIEQDSMNIVDDKVEIRHKRGDVRDDGKIFWGYIHKKECWLTTEKFDQYKLKEKESAKNNYLKNIDARKANFKEWYKANTEKNRQNGLKWLEANPEKRKETYKKYYINNKEKVKLCNKSWREKNKNKALVIYRTNGALRRARFKSECNLTKIQKKIIDCFYQQAQRLEKRFGIKFHVDHIIPLAKGGKHIPTNLQVLPASLNFTKHSRDIYLWSEYQNN